MKNRISSSALAGFVILFGLISLAGCGSGGSTGCTSNCGGGTPPPTVTWTNTANPNNLQNCGGASYSYPATASTGGVAYSLDNAALGTIDANGTVTADCSTGFSGNITGNVVATSTTDASVTAKWPVTLVNQIAYTKSGTAGVGSSDTWVANSDGTSPTKIISNGCVNPVYFKGHVGLACIANVNPQDQVQIYKTDGTTTATLTATLTFASLTEVLYVTPSPDGKTLLLVAEAPGTFGVYTASAADGSSLKPLYQETCSGNFCVGTGAANWSHDGKTIVYTDVVNGQGTIYTMAADGSDQTAWLPSGVAGDQAAFAVGDQEIYFLGSTSGTSGIYTDGLGEAPSQTPVVANGNYFALSPDGGSIVYDLQNSNGFAGIWVADAKDGSGAKEISPAPGSVTW